MYCKKCGKQLDHNGDICKDCAENEAYFGSAQPENAPAQEAAPTVAPAAPAQAAQPIVQDSDRKFGFGKALASTIMGVISYFVMSIAMGVPTGIIEVIEEAGAYGSGVADAATLGITTTLVFFVIAIGLMIPALIMGIQSIKTFVARKKAGYAKPIPTLVLGIVGVGACAMTVLFALLTLLLIGALALYI